MQAHGASGGPSGAVEASTRLFPHDVAEFLEELHNALVDRNHDLMKRLYEQDFNQLTETYYPNSRWPPESDVSEFYASKGMLHDVLISLYRELYYRHLVARCQGEIYWMDRFLSSNNYSRFLEYLIGEECKPASSNLVLPSQWLWDMLDEYVYQYQETQRWKAQYGKEISENDVAMSSMHHGSSAWRGSTVLECLYTIIDVSGIRGYLEKQKAEGKSSGDAGGKAAAPGSASELGLNIQFGYFAVISLMRLHVAMGDYRSALAVLSCIELSPSALYWKVPACHITLFYNMGFAYMMMRRYQDAIRVMCQVLSFVSRSRSYLSSQGYQQDAMLRMIDRMYHLVMLCNALSPTRLDESIQTQIQEKWADKYFKLQSDEEEAYREVFLKSCPKFFNPFVSDYRDVDEIANIDLQEPITRQLNMFMKDVSYQNKVFNVRSIAKLYNNLTLQKLANLMGMKNENAVEAVRSEMLCVKNRAEQLIWKSGPLLAGERVQMLADLDIYLEMNTIHVKNLTSKRNYADIFMKQINRTRDLLAMGATSAPVSSAIRVGGDGPEQKQGGR